MTVEIRPFGTRCNIRCEYCYQAASREAGRPSTAYDLGLIKEAVLAEGGPFSLFGGEPLLVPLRDLEDLWSFGFEHYGSNNVQTNGTLIRDEHVALFKKFNVSVGISLDGPGRLNAARWAGSVAATERLTERSARALERLLASDIRTSLIVTLHRGNATAEALPVLLGWFRTLDASGLRSARLHLLESETEAIRDRWALTERENIRALLAFFDLERELSVLRIDLFADMRQMLLGDDRRTTCIWKGCDPYTTQAVRGVEGNGQRSNCGRTNKDGIEFVKTDRPAFDRSLALAATAQASGGCRACRFFLMCKGNCPGTGIDEDWRNRSEHCRVWKAIFRKLEREMVSVGRVPLSLSPDRPGLEAEMIEAWGRGENPSLYRLAAKSPANHWRYELDQIAATLSAALPRHQNAGIEHAGVT